MPCFLSGVFGGTESPRAFPEVLVWTSVSPERELAPGPSVTKASVLELLAFRRIRAEGLWAGAAALATALLRHSPLQLKMGVSVSAQPHMLPIQLVPREAAGWRLHLLLFLAAATALVSATLSAVALRRTVHVMPVVLGTSTWMSASACQKPRHPRALRANGGLTSSAEREMAPRQVRLCTLAVLLRNL